jgi:tetratricopeptide (TPR) repeat protein
MLDVLVPRSVRLATNAAVPAMELAIPSAATSEYERAQRALTTHQISRAEELLRKAVAIAPQYAIAWNSLGTIAYQSQRYLEAEACFREALKHQPDAYPPLVNLGGALTAQRKYEESLAVNSQAARIRPDDALAQSQLGSSYFFLNRLDEAEEHFRRAKAIDPAHFSLPQVYLFEIYLRRGRKEDAASEITDFLRLHPDSHLVPELRRALQDLRR